MESRWIIKKEDSKLYAFIIAILPCIMMYKVPILEKGASTVIVLACAIILLINFRQIELKNTKLILPCLIYLIYVAFRSKGNWIEITLQIAAFIHLYAICTNIMNIEAFKRYIIYISVFAAICVIIQNVVHIILNIHIPMIEYRLCLDEMKSYTIKILTGINEGVERIYRPSAFFLEPAHMAEYTMLGLALCLLEKKKSYTKAMIISSGMVLTTSGMGIGILICIWGWYYFSQVNSSNTGKIKILIAGAFSALIVIAIAISIPGFQRILARIFGSFGEESSDYNAIQGRWFWWDTYFSGLNGPDLIYGKGSTALPDDYFTGFMEILYAYGLVGVCLYYFMIIYLLRKSNNAFSSCTIVLIGGLMFFANLTGFIQTICYLGAVLAGIKDNTDIIEKETNTDLLQRNECRYIRC